MRTKPLTLVLATSVLLATAGSAVAVNLTGDGTLVGCSAPNTTPSCASGANDNLTAGNGDDIVWGLGGSDNISAGNGNDVIDADGNCPTQDEGQRFPNGIKGTPACGHGRGHNRSDTDYITAGNGNDAVFSGAGTDNIKVGCGNDTIYGGVVSDTISAGSGCSKTMPDDVIWLGSGSYYTTSTVTVGPGDSVIHAQNGHHDTITCQKPNGTKVYADTRGTDSVSGCAQIIYNGDRSVNPYPARDTARVTKAKHHARHHSRKHSRKARRHFSF